VQYTIYYLFCRLVLEVLQNASEPDNPLSSAAADELEKACFLYFEENKYDGLHIRCCDRCVCVCVCVCV
jgi:hypothetical protein